MVRKPLGRLHGRFDGVDRRLRSIEQTLGSVYQAQDVMATYIKPLLSDESAEAISKVIDFQRYMQNKADNE